MSENTTSALRSDNFLNSIGVNIHIASGIEGNAYTNVANIVADLSYLGVTHVRDNIYPVGVGDNTFDAAYTTLAQAGIKFDLCVGSSNSDLAAAMAGIDAFAQADPGAISAIEGPNEINNFPFSYDGETGQAAAIAFQTALYATVQADPNLTSVPVYDFTGGSTNEPVAGLANYANIHVYPYNGDQPAWYITATNTAEYGNAAPLPEVITETGYNTDVNATSGVSLDAQAKMTLNLLMDASKDGVSETYLYELLDEYPDPTDSNSGDDWGLFSSTGSPLPAATAIHNLNSILLDTGTGAGTFTPGVLPYNISNLPSTGNSLLLEKSTGAFDLVVWNEPPIWNPTTETENTVTPTHTTVNLGGTYASVEVFDPLVGTSPIQTLSNTSTVELSLTDHPLIIEVEAPATDPVDVPLAASEDPSTPENTPVTINVLSDASDPQGTINPGSVTISTAATHGTTSVNTSTGAITYTPTAGYSGTDTFQYTVANTLGGISAPATVAVTVNPNSTSGSGPSPAPTAGAASATTEEGQPTTITVLADDSDPGGTLNPASVVVSSAAAHGTAVVNAGTGAITYTPAAEYAGTDTFRYTVANTQGLVSAPATVTLIVDAPPSTAADSATTTENEAVSIAVLSKDGDAVGTINPGSVTISTAATHGTTSVNTSTGAITYTPTAGYSGTDTFQYTVANTLGGISAPATVAVTVNPNSTSGSGPSPAPTAGAASATTEEGQPTTITVLADDSDPGGTLNPASVVVSSAAAHGTAVVNAGTGAITYTPAAEYAGTDTFRYTVANTQGLVSAPATVTLIVDAPPSTAADSATTTENEAVSIAVLSKDGDAVGTINPGSVTISTAATHGTTSVNTSTGAITYTPTAGYSGTDTFQYTVANTLGGISAPATVAVTVNPNSTSGSGPSPAPTAGAASATTEEGQPTTITVLADDSDPGGTLNPASVVVSSAAAHGTAVVNAGTGAITYTPAAEYAGTDTFRYTVANTQGLVSAPATVTLIVDAPPSTAADSATTTENEAVSIAVLSKDNDAVGTINPGSVTISTAATHGTTSVNTSTGAITYTPTAGYSGTDTFQYTVANTLGGISAPATVSVTVNPSSANGLSPTPWPNSGHADRSSTKTQLGSSLNGHGLRPPRGVGHTAGAALHDPSKISMIGMSADTTTHVMNVTGRNDTIENSDFAAGTNELTPITARSGATSLSVLYTTIDGGGTSASPRAITSLISDTGSGLAVKYNWLRHAPQGVIAGPTAVASAGGGNTPGPVVLGVSPGFIVPPDGGSGQAGSPSGMPDWPRVALGDVDTWHGVTRYQPGGTGDAIGPDVGIPASSGLSWTMSSAFAITSARADHALAEL